MRYEPGRLLGESLPPPFLQRLLPEGCLLLGALCATAAGVWVLASPTEALPGLSLGLGVLASALVGVALRLEARLGRRRFVLHFATEALRLEKLTWAPSATRAEWIPFDAVRAVEVVERMAPRRYALVVAWSTEGDEALRRSVLVEAVSPAEEEELLRVWRMLHNAFGLKGAGLAGG